MSFSLCNGCIKGLSVCYIALRSGDIMETLKEAVVFLVGGELERVLVVGEESIVSISQISKGTAL